jgi:signal transduction histidine kinase
MLRSLAEIVDGLYTRARFSLQARQAEQLAAIGLVGAGLAHELRNPIVALRTFAELLPKRLNDSEFLTEFAEIIPGEAKRIEALAEQLLDLSRPRKYEFASVDLLGVIAESLYLLRHRAKAAHIELKFFPSAASANIVADAQALRQVLLNLVLNSIQSIIKRGGIGKISVRTMASYNDLVIEVEDDGPGIPDMVRNRLFRPFASVGKAGGLGLGLAICSEIVRVHHGRISAEPHPDGALFRITLPIAGPNAPSRPPLTDNPDFIPTTSLPTPRKA